MGIMVELEEIAAAQRERQRAQDLEDFNNELHGNETGRLPRFLSVEAREALAEGKTGRQSKSSLSTLDWLLLNDPEFAQAYELAMDALADAEDAVQTALDQAIARAEETQLALDELTDKAMRLSDGRAVFMDQSGIVRDEKGNAIDPVLAATLEWQGYGPSFEDYLEKREADNEADAAVLAIREDQAELGEIRDELSDEDAELSTERVKELHQRVDEIRDTYIAPVDAPEIRNETSMKVEPITLG
ncbi:hypothetical protein B0E33_11380 [Roseibium algicola]|uniref:Uncharacterized protein n=1 Tax=Roseibium algicola TaxID=2857014 RepID=A0ABN4WXV0_9HYPH|nr:hypothetical protein [Roseibium aggregatum]AQQ04118.1 hypothetical protein B0E33_11380 [Roseibium aggregatum]